MDRIGINLFQERHNHRLIGLSVSGYTGIEEIQNLIRLIEDTLRRNYPDARLVRNKSVREILG